MGAFGNAFGKALVQHGAMLNLNGFPKLLKLTAISETQIDLAWTIGSTNHTGHEIYISSDNGATYALKGTVLGNVATYSATGLTASKLYSFYVKAFNANKSRLSDYSFDTTISKNLTFQAGNLNNITKTGLAYQGQSATSWSNYGLADEQLTGDFTYEIQLRGGNDVMIGLKTAADNSAYNVATTYRYFIFQAAGVYHKGESGGAIVTTGVTSEIYDILRIRRTSGVLYAEYYRNNVWTLLFQYSLNYTNPLYAQIACYKADSIVYYPNLGLSNNKVLTNIAKAVIVFDGNSLMAGARGTAPSILMKALNPFSVDMTKMWVNTAVFGQTTQQMITDAVTQIDSVLIAGGHNYLFAQEVGNDIVVNNSTPRQAVDTFWTYCDARRTAGWKVFIANLAARSTLTLAQIAEVNGYLAAEWQDHADAFIDLASRPELQDFNNMTYFDVDAIHNNTAGYEIWAQEFKQCLLKYIAAH